MTLGRLLAAGLAALLLAGCGTAGPRDSSGQVTAATTTDTYSIQVGDCVGKLDSDSTNRLPLVPCPQAHFWEAYASSDLPDGEFPGNTAVNEQAAKACKQAFKPFVGVGQGDSKYEVTYLTPTKETWNQARDREVVCLVGSSSGGLTGSLKGAAE